MAARAATSETLRRRFQTAVFFNLIGAVFNQGSTFVVNVLVANLLGRDVFGHYAIVQSSLATLALVAQFSTGYTATKFIAEFRSSNAARTSDILGMLAVFSTCLGILAATSLCLLSGTVARLVLNASDLTIPLLIGSGVVFFAVVNGFTVGALAGFEAYQALARSLVKSGLLYVAICTIGSWLGGVNGTIVGMCVSGACQCYLLVRALVDECDGRNTPLRWDGISRESRILLDFTIPGALNGFTAMPALWLASAFLVRQRHGFAEMAICSAALNILNLVLFLPNIANNVGMALINHHKGSGKALEYRQTFWANLVGSVVLVVLAGIVLAIIGPAVLRSFGKEFTAGQPVLRIFLFAAVIQTIGTATYQIIQTQGKMWLSLFLVNIPRDTLIVVLAYLFIPDAGALGYAVSYLIAWTVGTLSIIGIALHLGLHPTPSAAKPSSSVQNVRLGQA